MHGSREEKVKESQSAQVATPYDVLMIGKEKIK